LPLTTLGQETRWAHSTPPPSPHHSLFYRLDAPPAAQPTASMHRRQLYGVVTKTKNYIPTYDQNSQQTKHSICRKQAAKCPHLVVAEIQLREIWSFSAESEE